MLLISPFRRYGKGLEARNHPTSIYFLKKIPETFAHGKWGIMDCTLAHLFL